LAKIKTNFEPLPLKLDNPYYHSDKAVNLEGSVPFLAKPQLLDTIMCRQIIRPRCKLGLKFRVTRTNQELRWRFRAVKGKMTFGIYRQKIATSSPPPTVQQNNVTDSTQDIQYLMTDTRGKYSSLWLRLNY
jgi:hypothetical protein